MRMTAKLIVCIFGISLLSGCASSYMSPVVSPSEPADDNATVTFFRTSIMGSGIQAPVAKEAEKQTIEPVGVVSMSYKVRQEVAPGEHAYVVGGESSSLIKGTFEPNKHYYVRVEPRPGFLKARFVLVPVTKEELSTEDVQDEIKSCELMELNESGIQWFKEHDQSMRNKLVNAIKDYEEDVQDGDAVYIQPKDGIDELL